MISTIAKAFLNQFFFASNIEIKLNKKKLSKFAMSNKILELYYQSFFLSFKKLTVIKKAMIIRKNPIVTYFKLKSDNNFNLALY